MPYITDIYAREVLDSRGNPTIQVELETESGIHVKSIVPSGGTTGKYEALELRDKDPKRYNGKGVLKAIANVNDIIAPELIGCDCRHQREIDNIMIKLDGTANKSKLGANAILGVSIACAKAAAEYSDLPLYQYFGGFNACTLPTPMINILNGGGHTGYTIDIQEIMICPTGFKTFSEAIEASTLVFHALKDVLKEKGYPTTVADEGGYAPKLKNNEEAIILVEKAIKKAGYKLKDNFYIALDISSSEIYDEETKVYNFKSENKTFTYKELVAYYESLCAKHPIISIEDGVSEDDFEGWAYLTSRLGARVQLVGDDLFVTNCERLTLGIQNGLANSALIKINQIGTLSETFDAVELAKQAGYTTVISHRSGETEDTTIADIAVGLNTGLIKTGSLSRSERICKYNRLLNIEDELQDTSVYKGIKSFNFG